MCSAAHNACLWQIIHNMLLQIIQLFADLGQSQKINLPDQFVSFSNRTSCDFSASIQILLFSAISGNKLLSSLILTGDKYSLGLDEIACNKM